MRYAALLRAVNVGGKNKLPMKALTEMFVKFGCRDVTTYIQSGNVVFRAPRTLVAKLPRLVARCVSSNRSPGPKKETV